MRTVIISLFGVALLLTGVILQFILPGSRSLTWGVILLGVVLLSGAILLDFRRVGGALASRGGRFGLSTGLLFSIFLGVLLLANAISVENFHRFDFTGTSRFTLSSQTRDFLAGLDTPVEVVTFFTSERHPVVKSYTESLLEEYSNYTDQLSIRHMDPDLRPEQARAFGVGGLAAEYGVVIFRTDDGQRVVFGPQIRGGAEHAFTSALLEVSGTRRRAVYFLGGHGEGSIEREYRDAATGLRDNLFRVTELDLTSLDGLPDDATVIVIAGTRESWSLSAREMLHDYLVAGGRVLTMFDPFPPQSVRDLLSEWWIEVEDGVLIDAQSYVNPNRENVLVPQNRNAFELRELFFPGATATIPQSDVPSSYRLDPLAWTSSGSWLDRGAERPGDEYTFDSEIDRRGPLAIGALLSIPQSNQADGAPRGTRLAAIGDSEFARDGNFRSGNNAELFLSTVNWLAEGEEIISIDRRVVTTRRLLLTREQARFMHLSSIGLLPSLLLIAGLWAWWRRR